MDLLVLKPVKMFFDEKFQIEKLEFLKEQYRHNAKVSKFFVSLFSYKIADKVKIISFFLSEVFKYQIFIKVGAPPPIGQIGLSKV